MKIKNVRVLSPDCTVFSEPTDIYIENGKIAACGSGEEYDAGGKWLIPGMFELHGHFFTPVGRDYIDCSKTAADLYLANGVTTVVSKGATHLEKELDIKANHPIRLLTAGNWLSKAPASLQGVFSPDTCEEMLEAYRESRKYIDHVKIYTNMTAPWLARLSEEAHRDGYRVYAHIAAMTAEEAALNGVDGLEHGLLCFPEFRKPTLPEGLSRGMLSNYWSFDPECPGAKELLDLFIEKKVTLIPTVCTISSLILPEYMQEFERLKVWDYYSPEALENTRPAWERRHKEMTKAMNEYNHDILERQAAFLGEFHRRGGRILVGTDPSVAGLTGGVGMGLEALALEKCGMSKPAVLRALTSEAAKETGLSSTVGVIAPGMEADMVLLEADPLSDLSAVEKVCAVWRAGRIYDPAVLKSGCVGTIGK